VVRFTPRDDEYVPRYRNCAALNADLALNGISHLAYVCHRGLTYSVVVSHEWLKVSLSDLCFCGLTNSQAGELVDRLCMMGNAFREPAR